MTSEVRRIAVMGLSLLVGLGLLAPRAGAEDEPKVVPTAEAAKHAGQTIVVEFEVLSSRNLEGRDTCFLNSEKDFRNEMNFTVVVRREGLEKFKAAGVADPAAHFQGKRIRVRGKVTLREKKPQIQVDNPQQVALVKSEK